MKGVGYLIGGEALGFEHSSRIGEAGAPFVIEGDEYDTAFFDKRAKFLHYLPEIAVVTSLEFDHGDIYRSIEDIEIAFQRMLRQIPREGLLLLCADNHAASLADHAFSNVETYGFSETADWRGVYNAQEHLLHITHKETAWGSLAPSLAGRHNMSNTLATVAIAATLGMTAEAVAAAVAGFPGVRRRMEVFLEHNGVLFVDDFAHHPTAIRETIAAAKLRWPERRIRAVFEPRSNTTVTNKFQKELETAFQEADTVMLGPIHRQDSIPKGERLDRIALTKALSDIGIPATAFDSVPEILDALSPTLEANDIILIMSNGAFGGIYKLLRERFAAS